jgi:hypothetical protein
VPFSATNIREDPEDTGLELLVIGAPNLGVSPRDDVEGRRGWWTDS